MEYNKTLNLPQTDFPMRGNLPEKEPMILAKWEEENIYVKVQESNKGKPKYILHDGPPYANGDIHLGHTLNKVLKDLIIRYRSMNGYDAPYVPGWDTHGLPIEQQAIKNLGLNRHQVSVVDFRRQCRDYALKYVAIQKEQFKRLGVRGDWENPYLTLAPAFEAAQVKVFGAMANKGFIYKGLKPVYWCCDCETALAEAEVEYDNKRSASIYVKFAVTDGKGLLDNENNFIVIWTTTPWTLPANVAISLHSNLKYVLVKTSNGQLLMAEELYRNVMEVVGIKDYQVIRTFSGKELEGIVCVNPLFARDSVVILGEHVTTEQGTGCVHTAPGHGQEDYEVGKKYNLPVISPLDDKGRFTKEGRQFAGLTYEEANKAISKELADKGMLLNLSFIQHQFPHCWRCRDPIIFRATEQWFASIDGFRENALKAIDEVRWIPAWGRDRIYSMVAERGDWCISRQRTWGVPIPIFYCSNCDEPIVNDKTIDHVAGLFKEFGSEVWFAREVNDLVPPGMTCGDCGHPGFKKETDIMDVWFDSGSSHAAVLETHPDLIWPADLYLEGTDQHRGWFNSSLSTAVATRGKAPYKAVLTHGFLVDEQGRKMSKSLGNGIDPLEVIEKLGADILRLWVASVDYKVDVALSQRILQQITEAYRKIRNTCRFLLGNLYDYDYDLHRVHYQDLNQLDKWALMRLHKLIDKVTKAYDNYEFHTVYHAIHNFCVVDISAFYLDVVKDRIYTYPAGSQARRGAQTVIYETVTALVQMLAPILAFTSEEVWSYLPQKNKPGSIQLAGWPMAKEEYLDKELEENWTRIIAIRDEVAKVLEKVRKEKIIGHSLDAQVNLYLASDLYQIISNFPEKMDTFFIVSQVELIEGLSEAPAEAVAAAEVKGLKIYVSKAPGIKCERCWKYSETVGQSIDHPTICEACEGHLV